MAWQLIYTSAPRSLEAGRSGFGTVARHRAISPLLVSAIERASQFSRLPGADAGRVIFCHRIIAIAGGRFHVLSAIRDAGADYTGRTNHIAHHLIAEPREIAQLGANGPSPAEVALAMNWATSWSEPPRYLEAGDEVALATLHSARPGAWARITGDPNQAWLLASGEASRGAYLIQPAGLDLREVFAESLRLMPERRWQTTFTTSLQPSDEPADFRWIGIEEQSPLRAQVETSGRPILNLAAPGTLPAAEAAPAPVSTPMRNDAAPTSTPTVEERRTASPQAASTFARRKTGMPPPERNVEELFAPPPRSGPKWRLPAVAAILVAVLAIGGIFWVKPAMARGKARETVAARLKATDYFTDEEARRMAAKLVPKTDASRALNLADASNRLIQKLRNANLPALHTAETKSDLEILANRDGQAFPEELGWLRETASEARRLAQPPASLHETRDAITLAQTVKELRDDIRKLPATPPLAKLIKELDANADQLQATGLLAMIQKRLPPPEGIALFSKTVDDFASRTPDPEAQKTITEIRHVLAAPAKSSTTTTGLAPSPSNPVPTVEKPVAVSRPSLRFLRDNSSLTIDFPQQQQTVRVFLKADGMDENELKPYGGSISNGLGPNGDTLMVDNGQLKPKRTPPQPPYILIGKQDSSELFRAYVGYGLDENPIFGSDQESLKRTGDSVDFRPTLEKLPGVVSQILYLRLPPNFGGLGGGNEIIELSDQKLDLAPWIARLNTEIGKYQSATQHSSLDTLAKEEAEICKALMGSGIGSASKETANAADLFAQLLEEPWDTKVKSTPSPSKRIRSKLNQEDINWDVLLSELKGDFQFARKDWIGKSEFKQQLLWIDRVESFAKRVCEFEKKKQTAKRRNEAETKNKTDAAGKLKALQQHPILNGSCPSGIYQLQVDTGNGKVSLLNVEIR